MRHSEDDLVELALRVVVQITDQLQPALRLRTTNAALQLFASQPEITFGNDRDGLVIDTNIAYPILFRNKLAISHVKINGFCNGY